jgi:hypothetical protein
MLIKGWQGHHARYVREAVARIVEAPAEPFDASRQAAVTASGLPVYCDIGGCLVVREDGMIVEFSFVDDSVAPVSDAVWSRQALLAAAEKHEVFRDLVEQVRTE